ncbi:hypothetical protein GJ744_002599 [Endocarpon pusillum]|uniref:BZIP domain-containing protein n=1 Tax=Endocarpon pusillum TaxID=364733 RepID=A0A8H7A7P7_9EURO|nr:hypothetical protein GJ744_002599 [Endocarpon pusillum]
MSIYNVEEDWARIHQPESRKRAQNRLSQRRHRAKVRRQAASSSQEPVQTSAHFPSSHDLDIDHNSLSDEYLNPPLGQDEPGNMSTLSPTQQDFDINAAFSTNQPLPSNGLAPPSPGEWAAFSQSLASQSFQPDKFPLSSYPQPGGAPGTAQSSASSMTAKPTSAYQDENLLHNPHWAIPRPPSDSMQTTDLTRSIDSIPIPNPRDVSRPQSSHEPQRLPTPHHEHQDGPPRAVSRYHASCQPTQERPRPFDHIKSSRPQLYCQSADTVAQDVFQHSDSDQPLRQYDRAPEHKRKRSISEFISRNIPTSVLRPSAQRHQTQCSKCRYAPPNSPADHSTDFVTPRTPVSSPARGYAQKGQSHNLDILSDCGAALMNLVQQNLSKPKGKTASPSLNSRPRQSERRNPADPSSGSGINSFENDLSEHDEEEGEEEGKDVERVVIVYLRKGNCSAKRCFVMT